MKELNVKLKIFLISLYIVTLGTILFVYNKKVFSINELSYIKVAFFAVLLAVSESSRIVYKGMAISTSLAIIIATVILFGPLGSCIIITLGLSLRFKKVNGKYQHIFNDPIYKTFFNFSVLLLPVLYGALIYASLGGTFSTDNIWTNFHLVVIFSLIYLLLNTFLVSILFSLLNNKNPLYFFLSNVRLSFLNSMVMTPFAVMLALVFNVYGYVGVLLVVFLIVLVRYTFYLYLELKTQYVETVDTLMHAVEARDKYTEGHSKRVAEISTLIAKEFKYNDMRIERLHMASLLHDVGKIGIDDKILNKPGILTKEEYEIIKSHPEIGYNILKDIKNLQDILPIVRSHHERYDGKGYPDGKKSEELELDVFIIQLADTIDAMTTDRPYRKALSHDEVISEIKKYSGSQFHPKVVEAYLNMVEKQKKAV
jgi:putative nucleotidyltransferase with HDIG domain